MPTLLPHLASARARFTATVVLPTPPLPAPTAMMSSRRAPIDAAVGADRFTHACAQVDVDRRDARHLHHRGARLIAHLILTDRRAS